ncbi:MAG: TonB-dependent receptor [Bacteroidetes bacterium]|nr:TonB-dependent receptor [Bacteroidota bacterium]
MNKAAIQVRFLFLTIFTILCFITLPAQEGNEGKGEVKGTIKDPETGETIIGANVTVADGKGTITDINGNYSLKLDKGEYTLTITSIGYNPIKQKIKISDKPLTFNFSLQPQVYTTKELEVVADVAKMRETPVAFSNVSAQKIQEELGNRDLPMVLNSTPGAYATEQGGGAGDARITIRGFDQRNVAVMIDGVPVNDMENGWVYWSNWAGLSDVTQNMQVQRGLGASKLAVASVGGTINVMTRGIDQKRAIILKQEVGNNKMLKTSLSFNSGLLKGGWGITAAGARTTGDGWADQTWNDQWSYFIKIQKRLGNHLLSASAIGAPQSHGQRSFKMPIPILSKEYAKKAGMTDAQIDSVYRFDSNKYTTPTQGNRGATFNPNWGIVNGEYVSERMNYFHKPQFNLSHSWNVTPKLYLSNIAYLSVGKGGGTGYNTTSGAPRDSNTGAWDMQKVYDQNSTAIDALYSTTENKSSRIIRSSINNHYWIGLLSTAIWTIDTAFTFTGGLDARYYRGMHYQEVYDLLGGDYYRDNSNKNQKPTDLEAAMKRKGDKITYHNDGIVIWGGTFVQLEYTKNKWSAFLTLTGSQTGYQRIDYFKKKDLVLSDTTFKEVLGANDSIVYKDKVYYNHSAEARAATTDRVWYLGYTIKGGSNYNINDHHNVFANIGYLEMAPRFNNVFDNNNKLFLDVENQKVKALEFGYGYRHQKVSINFNAYMTHWENKPQQNTPTVSTPDGTFSYNINGLTAIHKGLELDGIYKITSKIDVEGAISIGDWITDTEKKVFVSDDNNIIVDSVEFKAKGVHVGDAAQIQYAGSVRYEPIKALYIKAKYTYFDKNFSNFDPTTLTVQSGNANRESWQMPAYGLVDVNFGYGFKYWKLKFDLNGGVFNVLNTEFISDAQNGLGFNAYTAQVFMGQGRRFNIGLKITY